MMEMEKIKINKNNLDQEEERYKKKIKIKNFKRIHKKKRFYINYKLKKNLLYLFLIILIIPFSFLIWNVLIRRKNINYSQNNHKLNKLKYFACFCTIARMENRYARELISYYSKIGVDKFIFGDNNVLNTEKLSDVLQDYINNNLVDIHEIFGSDTGQAEFYQSMYEKYNSKCNYFLFFDFDEYLEIHFNNNTSLQNLLTNNIFNNCESISFNWLTYTDNDLIYYDKRTLIERFTQPNYDDTDNLYVKSIVKGGLNKTIFYPQQSNHIPDSQLKICDSKGNIIPRYAYNPYTINPPIYENGFLKHFSTKTAEEYCNKMERGGARNLKYDYDERLQIFFRINKFSKKKLKIFEEKFNRTFNYNH